MIQYSFRAVVLILGLLSVAGCSTTGSGAAVGEGSAGKVSDASGVASTGLGSDTGFADGAEGRGSRANAMKVGDQTYYFAFNESAIRADDRPSIEVQARYLAAHSSAKVLLEGNTDPRGSREYNVALGERRANAVADVLMELGVQKSQIRVVSYGAEKLASQGTTDEDYQRDRRTHLVYEAK